MIVYLFWKRTSNFCQSPKALDQKTLRAAIPERKWGEDKRNRPWWKISIVWWEAKEWGWIQMSWTCIISLFLKPFPAMTMIRILDSVQKLLFFLFLCLLMVNMLIACEYNKLATACSSPSSLPREVWATSWRPRVDLSYVWPSHEIEEALTLEFPSFGLLPKFCPLGVYVSPKSGF